MKFKLDLLEKIMSAAISSTSLALPSTSLAVNTNTERTNSQEIPVLKKPVGLFYRIFDRHQRLCGHILGSLHWRSLEQCIDLNPDMRIAMYGCSHLMVERDTSKFDITKLSNDHKAVLKSGAIFLKILLKNPQKGIDEWIIDNRRNVATPIISLETQEEQLKTLDGVEDCANTRDYNVIMGNCEVIAATCSIWREGDLETLNRVFQVDVMNQNPIMQQRNKVMAEGINKHLMSLGFNQAKLEDNSSVDGRTFAVMGAFHLGGSFGTLELLRKQGYSFTQIISTPSSDDAPEYPIIEVPKIVRILFSVLIEDIKLPLGVSYCVLEHLGE